MATEPKVRALQALSTRMLDRVPSGAGHDAWRELWAQVNHLAETATALHNLHVTRNPTENDAAHLKRVATAAAKLKHVADDALDRSNRTRESGLAAIKARIAAKVRLVPDAYAAEIRAAYRAMSSAAQTTMLRELIEQNRGPEVAAIVKAPALLTGMSEQHRAQYEAAFIATNAPEEVTAQEALAFAHETALVSARTASEVAREYSDPAALAKITAAESAAAAAAKVFDAKARSAA
jgi:hypothetical protein